MFQPLAFQPAFQQIQGTGGIEGEAEGGWAFFIRHQEELDRRRRKRREYEEAQEEVKALEPVDREIATLLQKQVRADDRKADLERLRSLVDRYSDEEAEAQLNKRLADAFQRVRERQTVSSLLNLEKELRRMYEEDELAVLMLLLND